jgi:RHS repeat-associated protein
LTRESESGNDNFGARYYSSNLGRFMSPDEPNVDQDPTDPQSWNLYTYVRNNPLNNTDPNGQPCIRNGDGNYVGDCQSTGDEKVTQGDQPQTVHVSGQPGFSFWDGLYFAARVARAIQTNGDKLANLIERIPAPPDIPESWKLAIGMATGSPEFEAAEELTTLTKFSGILREAAAAKGMGPAGNVVEVTAGEAEELGKAWVGSGARVASDGKSLVSSNGLRVYRPAEFKPSLGKVQANLEQKVVSGGRPVSNFHWDIK